MVQICGILENSKEILTNIPSTERCGMLELKSGFCWRSSLARGSLLRITEEKHLEVATQMIETETVFLLKHAITTTNFMSLRFFTCLNSAGIGDFVALTGGAQSGTKVGPRENNETINSGCENQRANINQKEIRARHGKIPSSSRFIVSNWSKL